MSGSRSNFIKACFTTAALLASGGALANQNAADSVNADQLWANGGLGLNLTGAGVNVGIWEADDPGWQIRASHEAFRSYNSATGLWDGPSRVTFGNSPGSGTDRHATHVAGTLGGAHLPGKESTWGMAPGVNIVTYDSEDHYAELTSATQVDISNHSYLFDPSSSWGPDTFEVSDGNGGTVFKKYDRVYGSWDISPSSWFGEYDFDARELDKALNAQPKLVSFWAAGNSRDDGIDNFQYTDYQSDGMYVTRFSTNFENNNTIIGEEVEHSSSSIFRLYLVSTDDYPFVSRGFEPGGYFTIKDMQAAKNNVVVGATEDFTDDPHESNGNGIRTTAFSSYGPTDDGRLGVDLVANGRFVNSASNGSDSSYTLQNGTSMASPTAAGTAALLLEHWRNENGGYTPDSATQKGLLMHTATDATRDGQVGPDYRTGYGMINAAEAAGHITESIDEPLSTRDRHAWEDTLMDGESESLSFLATGGFFKASLSWLDPTSAINYDFEDRRTPRLVNDLDLWVTDEFGNTYWTWVLDPENPANAATQDAHNRVDNFTQVYIDGLDAGTELTLHLGHIGSLLNGSQDYALFITGGTLVPEPGSLALLALGAPLFLRRRRR